VLTRDEDFAYITSVRKEGIGEQDIYKVDIRNWKEPAYNQPDFADAVLAMEDELPALARPVVAVTPVITPVSAGTGSTNFTVFVAEGDSRKPIQASVKLTSGQGEIQFNEIKQGSYQTEIKNTNNAAVRYKLLVTSQEYIPYSSSYYFYGTPLQNNILSDTIYLDKIAVNYRRTLNVYFPIDSDVPKTFEDILYLEQIMKTSSTIKVEVSGHTDNTGLHSYNIGLSQRRAEAVKKHLVQAGIDSSRITVAGYGPDKPISDNKTKAGRQLNRRTEFTIIEK